MSTTLVAKTKMRSDFDQDAEERKMSFDSYKEALKAEPFDEIANVECILDSYYHSGTPHVVKGDDSAHGQFRRSLANEISSSFGVGCHPHHVVVCGSAHQGFSASPYEKFGTPFSFDKSDVDVAILLPELFDRWWLELVEPKTVLGKRRADIADHMPDGYINPQLVRGVTETGMNWWRLFGEFTEGRFSKVRGRIYRGPQFMQNYHRLSVLRGREKLLGARSLTPFTPTFDFQRLHKCINQSREDSEIAIIYSSESFLPAISKQSSASLETAKT